MCIGYIETPVKSRTMLPEDVVDLIKNLEKEDIVKINNIDQLCNKLWYIFSDSILDFNLSIEEQQKKITEWRNNNV